MNKLWSLLINQFCNGQVLQMYVEDTVQNMHSFFLSKQNQNLYVLHRTSISTLWGNHCVETPIREKRCPNHSISHKVLACKYTLRINHQRVSNSHISFFSVTASSDSLPGTVSILSFANKLEHLWRSCDRCTGMPAAGRCTCLHNRGRDTQRNATFHIRNVLRDFCVVDTPASWLARSRLTLFHVQAALRSFSTKPSVFLQDIGSCQLRYRKPNIKDIKL